MRYWSPYVPVAERKAKAAKLIKSAKSKGKQLNPVIITGKQIARTFWGKAWCDNVENYSDYCNRLPRGRTYVRNGSVIDLQVSKGRIYGKVMGSSLYNVEIKIQPMSASKWEDLIKACSGKIDSLIELLQGKFSDAVMKILIDPNHTLFPPHKEISMACSCPDGVGLCKHTAAVLYGMGSCLDQHPEWLFCLRHVDHLELIAQASGSGILTASKPGVDLLDETGLSSLFGIDMAPDEVPVTLQKAVPPKPPVAAVAVEESVELTVSQAAVLLQVTEVQLSKLLRDKIISCHQVGKKRWISFEEIIRYRKRS